MNRAGHYKRGRLPPHWYYQITCECVLCGRTARFRVRRYDPRPADPAARFGYEQEACGIHFC